ncbi:histidine phosphatase family protein [Paenibacillus sambharensis]|uniref:Histidine phosphatase family protein n=1 Tax=Paenibacillus sambharensis TaxID=1803190 RepID=A0A2W1LQ71_9BACL|nr:histidine phosphatase family protein [Paenibacillus sambharensis]
MSVRIGLIRHGRTEWNALGKIQGQTDIPLNEEGIRQAEALARRLSAEEGQWDAIVSSDLRRAFDTAAIIARTLNIPHLPPDPRIRERSFGVIEGTTEEERLSRWGADWRQADAGQESDESIVKRGMAFIDDWRTSRPEARLLVVSHGSFLAQLFQAMCRRANNGYLVNMSYSVLEYTDSSWQPLLENCTLHLQDLAQRS